MKVTKEVRTFEIIQKVDKDVIVLELSADEAYKLHTIFAHMSGKGPHKDLTEELMSAFDINDVGYSDYDVFLETPVFDR